MTAGKNFGQSPGGFVLFRLQGRQQLRVEHDRRRRAQVGGRGQQADLHQFNFFNEQTPDTSVSQMGQINCRRQAALGFLAAVKKDQNIFQHRLPRSHHSLASFLPESPKISATLPHCSIKISTGTRTRSSANCGSADLMVSLLYHRNKLCSHEMLDRVRKIS